MLLRLILLIIKTVVVNPRVVLLAELYCILCMPLCIFIFFECSTFVGSAWSFGFFIPATMANDLQLLRIFIPDFYILILEKEPVFPFIC